MFTFRNYLGDDRETFLDPSKFLHAAYLKNLNEFIRFLHSCPLPKEIKESAIKVLETSRWIRCNLDKICYFIDHKGEELPKLPERDRRTSVLRDHLGTAIHFNGYANGEEATDSFKRVIEVIENFFINHRQSNIVLLCFITQFNYTDEVGCFEARTSSVLNFINDFNRFDRLSLSHLLQLCKTLYFTGHELYDFVIANAFFLSDSDYKYGENIHHEQKLIEMTPEIVFEEIQTILAYDKPDEDELNRAISLKEEDPTQWFCSLFEEFVQEVVWVNKRIEGSDPAFSVHFYFKNKTAAFNFSNFLSAVIQTNLQSPQNYIQPNRESVERYHNIQLNRESVERYSVCLKSQEYPFFRSKWDGYPMGITILAKDDELLKKNQLGNTLLHWIVAQPDFGGYYNSIIVALARKVSGGTLKEAIKISGYGGNTPLHFLFSCEGVMDFYYITENIPIKDLMEALHVKNEAGNMPIDLLLNFPVNTFQFFIFHSSFSKPLLNAMMRQKKNFLEIIIEKRMNSRMAAEKLMNMISREDLYYLTDTSSNEIICKFFYWIFSFPIEESVVISFIFKINPDVLRQIFFIEIEDENKNTLLNLVIRKNSALIFEKFINVIDPKNLPLTHQNNHGDTPLHVAAKEENNHVLPMLCDLIPQDQLYTVLSIKNSGGNTPFHLMAKNLYFNALKKLLNKLTPAGLVSIMTIEDFYGDNLLHYASDAQSSELLEFFFKHNTLSPMFLSSLLVFENFNRKTPLEFIFKSQNKNAFNLLMEKKIFTFLHSSFFSIRQDRKTSLAFWWGKIHTLKDQKELQRLLFFIIKIASIEIITLPSLESSPLFTVHELKNHILPLIIESIRVPVDPIEKNYVNLNQIFLKNLENEVEDEVTQNNLLKTLAFFVAYFAICRLSNSFRDLHQDSSIINIRLGDNRIIHLTDSLQYAEIENAGFASWVDFYLFKFWVESQSLSEQRKVLQDIIDSVIFYNELKPNLWQRKVIKMNKELDEGNLGVKVFRNEQNGKDFIDYLKKPTHRPKLRDSRIIAPTHKFCHLTGMIEPYVKKLPSVKYELALLSSLSNGDKEQVEEGKIYLSDNGKYMVRDASGVVQEGLFDMRLLEGGSLANKLNDKNFKDKILITTFNAGHTIRKESHKTHSKKTSATLLSPLKCTDVFFANRSLPFGVVFQIDPHLDDTYRQERAKIKAMLTARLAQNTHARGWRGSLEQVQHYQRQNGNFTSLLDFKAHIKELMGTNEILVQISSASLCAIFILSNAGSVLAAAASFREQIKTQLNLELPIVLYKPSERLFMPDYDHFLSHPDKSMRVKEQHAVKPLFFSEAEKRKREREDPPSLNAKRLRPT
ncbi:MAG: hypothetical protein A3F10_00190 [Coxiella sp. RIFCSPHIGHO2_12_FULL_42_15]|nr:MAG: hypothetical protein A3F10_00190 [Coxiella sp. RIFCSPHIGHO2_12_FULL_42_15]